MAASVSLNLMTWGDLTRVDLGDLDWPVVWSLLLVNSLYEAGYS